MATENQSFPRMHGNLEILNKRKPWRDMFDYLLKNMTFKKKKLYALSNSILLNSTFMFKANLYDVGK